MPVQLLVQLPMNITFWKEQVWLKWTRRPLKITATCIPLDRTICFSMLLRGKQWASLCFGIFLSGVLADTRKPNLSYLQLMHKQSLQSNEPLTTDSSNLIQQTCHKQCPDVIHIYPTISTTQSPLSRPATLAYERCQVKSWNKKVAALPRLLVDSCASPCIGGTSLKRIPSLRVIKQETPRPPWAIFLKSLIQRLQKSIAAPQHMIR